MRFRSVRSKIVLPLVLLAAVMCGVHGGARKPAQVTDDDKARAAYLFMEANSNLFADHPGTAYMMMRRAAELDPEDISIQGSLGELVLSYGIGDSAAMEQAYEALRNRFVKNPDDFVSGEVFANVAEHLDREEDVREIYKLLSESHPLNPDYALHYAWLRAKQYNTDPTAIDDALRIYQQLEDRLGYDNTIMVNRVRAMALRHDSTAVMNEILRYAATAPADPETNLTAGTMLMMVQMPDSAIKYIDRACELDPTSGEAFLARANYYSSQGDSVGYDTQVMQALQSQSLEVDSKIDILTNYVRKFYTDESRHSQLNELFAKMIDMHPGEAPLHNLYGAFLATTDSARGAAEQFGYAMDLDPDNEDYAHYSMQLAFELGDSARVIEIAESASKRFNNVYFPVMGSSVLNLQHRYPEALAMLDSFDLAAIDNRAAISAYHQARADILHGMGERDSAYAEYDKALDYNPGNIMVLNNMAYYLAVDGIDLDRAEDYIKRALVERPNSLTFLDTYAWVLFKKKDYRGAKVQIDLALEECMPLIDSAEVVDSVAYDSDEDIVIEEVLDGVYEDGETVSAEIYDHAGDIYFMNGEPDEAVEFWKKAEMLDPENEKIKKKIKNKAYFFE